MFINSLRKSPFSCSPGLILLGAFTLLSVPVYGQQIQQAERQVQQVPFLQFNFDEQGGETARNSGRGGSKYDARINGGTVEWGPGLQQGAARLSNKGHFKLPDGVLAHVKDFTLSVWVYLNEQSDNQTVCTFACGTDRYLILTTQRGNEENGVSLVMTKTQESGNHTDKEERIAYTRQKGKLSANAWHHLAFTLKGSVGTLYVDGVKAEIKTDFTVNPSLLGNTTDNYIGRPTWPDPYLNGGIDDFRLYDYALTDRQVYELASVADGRLVQEDRDGLSLGDLSAVTTDLVLPSSGKSGTTISWSSAQGQYISDSGKLYRPDAGTGNKKATLTATVRKGDVALTKDFVLTVKDIGTEPEDVNVFSMQTGNPTVPAYLADASFYYDGRTKTFYAFGTNDGAGGENVYPAQMWYSKDCKEWKNKVIAFPKSWTDYAGTLCVWAPSIEYNPDTKKYYLMYSIASNTFVGMANDLLGPWEDANGAAPGKMLFKGYDGQFFMDDDRTMYIVTDSWHFKIMKLKFDEAGKIYIDNSDPVFAKSDSNPFIGTYHYTQIEEIKNAFEASFIFKRNNLYYLMWSFNGSENYNVRYAVADKITGPYREINRSMTVPILQRDDANRILGPGHHSMFCYGGRTFIAYHRQHYPFVDSKRQTCIDEVFFNEDGSIRPIIPTHKGVTVAPDVPGDHRTNLALGKQTLTSSARVYDDSEFAPRYRTHGISFCYAGNFAVDENYGTHWDPGVGAHKPWLIVDLGSECKVDEIETIFEFTSRTYKYKLEYLSQKEAGSLDAASGSHLWKVFADRSTDGVGQSPVTDTKPGNSPVKARFIRLTILEGVDIPLRADGLDKKNAENALSIFELKVFGEDRSDALNRIFEAESFHNLYGIALEKNAAENGFIMGQIDNNDYLLYRNVDLGKGAGTFTAKVASGTEGGKIEVYLGSLKGKPIGVLEVGNTGGDQSWEIKSTSLERIARGRQEKLYLLFKGKTGTENLLKLDWFQFTKDRMK